MEDNLKQSPVTVDSPIKIALFGPESTGKTTLAQQLADHFDTVWTPEFARNYLQQKWDEKQQICTPEDLIPIAAGQTQLENESLLQARKFLFADTCLMVTKVFSEIYYGFCDPALDKAARKHKYDLFFLTNVDMPWKKDDLRDRPENREATFEAFKKALADNQKPFIVLSGNEQERLDKAIAIVQSLEKAKKMGFSSQDFVQLYEHRVSLDAVENHLRIFKSEVSKTILDRPATTGDGILKLSDAEFERAAQLFDSKKSAVKLKKFVPASGAASRMFKFLSEFINEFDHKNETINAYINRKKAASLTIFLAGIEKFPFFETVDRNLRAQYADFNSRDSDWKNYHFIKMLLDEDYFDFCNKPKGILPFHKYADTIATPIEEHLRESAFYASSNGISHLHFTVSEIHQKHFEKIIANVKGSVEAASGTKIEIRFTYQDKATDTIAVDPENKPFRNEDGELVFRPGGHGALIANLDNLNADIVFIKNIDNVIQNHIREITLYKKALAGILMELQQQIFDVLRQMENGAVAEADIAGILSFLKGKLNLKIKSDFAKYTLENKIAYIKEILNRPIRVCGMVKNEGEPGGGPFWVRDLRGNTSLQIVETAQVDLLNPSQGQILAAATHFNPVDLVCGIRDYQGNKFSLADFVDPDSGFIVAKNKNGKDLKAYELPGLWNGAMAKWLTVFVEVPLVTFNPVKTVNDLLKPPHQPQ